MRRLNFLILTCCVVVLAGVLSRNSYAEDKGKSTTRDINDPLKVRGQTRNLNMQLILRSKEDKIKFIKIRKNYKDEILGTQY